MATKLHISYEWLKNGVGEMFLPEDDALLLEDPTLYNMDKTILKAYITLPPEVRKVIKDFTLNIAAKVAAAEKQTPAPAVEEPKTYKEELTEEEHNLLEQHRRSMELRKGAAG